MVRRQEEEFFKVIELVDKKDWKTIGAIVPFCFART
jgi:hypothetical protein